jgi:PHP family Zn ribbon phosphoesterase
MKFFADFNLHSKYSRGAHPDMDMPTLAKAAKLKGIGLLGTGDFTHPQWLVELKKFLKPASGRGIYEFDDAKFILTSEVVCVYTRGGRTYKINQLLFAPNFTAADRLIDALERHGDLETEARPSVKLSVEDFVKAVLDAAPEALVAPAHAWGLQHSLFSPSFGYDALLDAYGSQADHIRVVETGLCADPLQARRWSQLDGRTLISNSDAHHPAHLGRECNIFDCPMDYKEIMAALVKNDRTRLLGTVEEFVEEDRYHLPGHRACQQRGSVNGRKENCPACGKPMASGVAERVNDLADRSVQEAAARAEPFHRTVPLSDIIADALGFQPDAESVQRQYASITSQEGPELEVLLNWPEEQLRRRLSLRVAEGVLALRRGDVTIEPGYDGVPGRVRVKLPEGLPADPAQLKLF